MWIKNISWVFLAGFSQSVLALAPTAYQEERNGFTYSAEANLSYNDNYQTEQNASSAWVTSISPKVEFKNRTAASIYEMSMSLNQRFVEATNNSESQTDVRIEGSTQFALDPRNRVGFDGKVQKTESLQNTYTAGFANAFTEAEVNANYEFGGLKAKGNLQASLGHKVIRSDNAANKEMERDTTRVNGAFIYRTSPDTRMTAEAEYQRHQYVSNSRLDGHTVAMLLGMKWDSSAKLTRFFKAGVEQRSFDGDRESAQMFTWQARSEWKPVQNAVIGLESSQSLEEGYSGSDLVDKKRFAANWSHRWNPRFVSDASTAYETRDFSSGREDGKVTLAMKMQYQLKRWLSVQLGVQHVNQDSNENANDFQQNIYSIGVEGKL